MWEMYHILVAKDDHHRALLLVNTAYGKFQPRSFNPDNMLFAVALAFVQRTFKRANRHLPVHVFLNALAGCYN